MSQSGYTVESLPRMRQLITDIGWFARQSDPILGLLELDVTEARARIQAHQVQTGERLSFTAFLVACIAQAVGEHKHVHAMRNWRGQLVIFDDVDVTTMVEIEADGIQTPVGLIIRTANRKSLRQIHAEIRTVQTRQTHSQEAAAVRFFTRIPRWLRRLMIRVVARMPHPLKQMRGTIVVTAVGMFGATGWALALPSHSLNVFVGSITPKPRVVDGQVCVRDVLHLTLGFDHTTVDGAPAARFAARLQHLIEGAAGLDT